MKFSLLLYRIKKQQQEKKEGFESLVPVGPFVESQSDVDYVHIGPRRSEGPSIRPEDLVQGKSEEVTIVSPPLRV